MKGGGFAAALEFAVGVAIGLLALGPLLGLALGPTPRTGVELWQLQPYYRQQFVLASAESYNVDGDQVLARAHFASYVREAPETLAGDFGAVLAEAQEKRDVTLIAAVQNLALVIGIIPAAAAPAATPAGTSAPAVAGPLGTPLPVAIAAGVVLLALMVGAVGSRRDRRGIARLVAAVVIGGTIGWTFAEPPGGFPLGALKPPAEQLYLIQVAAGFDASHDATWATGLVAAFGRPPATLGQTLSALIASDQQTFKNYEAGHLRALAAAAGIPLEPSARPGSAGESPVGFLVPLAVWLAAFAAIAVALLVARETFLDRSNSLGVVAPDFAAPARPSALAPRFRLGPTLARRVARAIRTNPTLDVGLLLTAALFYLAVFPSRLTIQDPHAVLSSIFLLSGNQLLVPPFPPSSAFPLGTDRQGRDLWSWIAAGADTTLALSLAITAVRLVIGAALGFADGWLGGTIGRYARIASAAGAAFPALLQAYLVVVAIGADQGPLAFLIGLGFTGWAQWSTFIAAQIRRLRAESYVEGAVAVGVTPFVAARRYVLPNVAPVLIPALARELGGVMLMLAELGFLGVYWGSSVVQPLEGQALAAAGPQLPPNPEWGALLAGTRLALFSAPWQPLAPAAAFLVAIAAALTLGAGLSRVVDPLRNE